MKCNYCDEWLGGNEDAMEHAGKCKVMNADNSPADLPEAGAGKLSYAQCRMTRQGVKRVTTVIRCYERISKEV